LEKKIYELLELKIQANGKTRRFLLKEFETEREAEDYKCNILRFRPHLWLEIEPTIKNIPESKPEMGFFEKVKLAEEIKVDIKMLKEGDLRQEAIEQRLKQFVNMLWT
jgi:hypothetical protein